MNGKSLGIIETIGFVPAVEAADAAVKSANVSLIGRQFVGGGMVSILITGDVGSVKASVDAAKSAAQRVGKVKSTTVIARTAQGLETIVKKQKKETPLEKSGSALNLIASKFPEYGKSELEKLTVQELRNLARKLKNFTIAKDKIKYSRKEELIRAIVQNYRKQKELD